MHKCVEDQYDSSEDSEEEEQKASNPLLRFESIPHKGAVNRIRSMHGSAIVATWNEDGEVGIYDVTAAVAELDVPVLSDGKPKQPKSFGGSKLSSFKHSHEGFALDWSPLTLGRLASGSCNS